MDKTNFANGDDIPLGLGMALAQNINAMEHFSRLSPQEKQSIINQTHSIESKSEMQSYVNNLVQK